ncbi:MAG: hypothetical protein ABEN55_19860 [Bradymonadaceae bacterium]
MPSVSRSTAAITAMVVGAVGLSVWLLPASAEARDSDESRLGAEEHVLGSTHRGKLAPPDDGVDWRYIKVEKTRTISFSVEVDPVEKVVDLTLTRATGVELDSISSDEGEGTFERELEPGLYYLKVGASAPISYALTIE